MHPYLNLRQADAAAGLSSSLPPDRPRQWLVALALILSAVLPLAWAQAPQGGGGEGRRGEGPTQPVPALPERPALDVIVGRPGATGATLSVLCYQRAMELRLQWRRQDGGAVAGEVPASCQRDLPQEIRLEGLAANSRYRFELRDAGNGSLVSRGAFHTGRAAGSHYVFTLTADSHLDGNSDPALYLRTLSNVLADGPDFHIDLGDTFMTDKHSSRDNALQQYRAQRVYFGKLAGEVPLFLVLGNHDGESSRLRRGAGDSLAVWANRQRKTYFPNPLPDAFYAGNRQPDAVAGELQDYYAWRWGDAQFIVLNPYWHGSGRREDEPWELTLGQTQYQWLKQTLESTRPRFRFVFVHQLVGGFGRQGRGGVEAAALGEWGGRNADGSDGFAARRPGWELPIHALLRRYGVSAVFHGHDHLYARQELDGIVYQEVPQPAHPGDGLPPFAADYGYREGKLLGGAGHLRISVSPERARVEFVRASTAANRPAQVVHDYTIAPRQ